jgi:hypothetical protein
LLLSLINPASYRFLFSLCAAIVTDTTFGIAGKVRTDFGHADFHRAWPAALRLAYRGTPTDWTNRY